MIGVGAIVEAGTQKDVAGEQETVVAGTRAIGMAGARAIVVMGVSGCGKSTIGAALAPEIGGTFVDGDDLHPAANIAKMSVGEPLTDADRAPWLDEVGKRLAGDAVTIIGCSALKKSYRDRIRAAAARPVAYVHLTGSRAVLATRMQTRPGHFMPPALLDSQLATLEPPGPDEAAVAIDIDQPPDAIVVAAAAAVRGA